MQGERQSRSPEPAQGPGAVVQLCGPCSRRPCGTVLCGEERERHQCRGGTGHSSGTQRVTGKSVPARHSESDMATGHCQRIKKPAEAGLCVVSKEWLRTTFSFLPQSVSPRRRSAGHTPVAV